MYDGVMSDFDAKLLKEAADWVMTLHYGHAGDKERIAFENWRQQSPAHGAAWARAESVVGIFQKLPSGIGKDALQTLHSSGRRRSLRLLGMFLVAAPAGLLTWRQLPWEQWTADFATATGESKSIMLADGTQLVLNTASAVNIKYTRTERRIQLAKGELLITTHSDPSPTYRPFLVETPQGEVQALGTRFSVRRLDDKTRVAVFKDTVEIRPQSGIPQKLSAGQQTIFTDQEVHAPTSVENSATLWEQGMLLAKNMRLSDVVAEMGRYRTGILRCHSDVAEMRVSGSISLSNTDAGLALLEQSLPLRVETATRYWVMLRAK